MNKSESKYYNTALCMDKALLQLLEKKDFEFITIKEICKTAGVNRSTFYLHYENLYDLLEETINMISKEFYGSFSKTSVKEELYTATAEDMFFITPDYLYPYLNFIKNNLKLFKTIHNKPILFNVNSAYKKMCNDLFFPILSKFKVPQEKRPYVLAFYTKGLYAVVDEWICNNCKDDIETIVKIMLEFITYES